MNRFAVSGLPPKCRDRDGGKHRFSRRAFSLVELVIALGITAFALVAILAVLPVGLDAIRGATEQFLQARIIRKISADLRTLPFDVLADGSLTFDYEGAETVVADDIRYRATFTMRQHGANTFPGAPSTVQDSLAVFEVEIYRTIPGSAGNPPAVSFPLLVARGY